MPKGPLSRGQISFDLIITLLVALIVLQSSIAVLRNIEITQNEIQIRNQEVYIALEVNRAIEISKTLGPAPLSLTYQIPKISVLGFVGRMDLDANVIARQGKITVIAVEPVSAKTIKREFAIGSLLTDFNKTTGETINCMQGNVPAECV